MRWKVSMAVARGFRRSEARAELVQVLLATARRGPGGGRRSRSRCCRLPVQSTTTPVALQRAAAWRAERRSTVTSAQSGSGWMDEELQAVLADQRPRVPRGGGGSDSDSTATRLEGVGSVDFAGRHKRWRNPTTECMRVNDSASPFDHRGSPREAGAEHHQQDQVAALDATRPPPPPRVRWPPTRPRCCRSGPR